MLKHIAVKKRLIFISQLPCNELRALLTRRGPPRKSAVRQPSVALSGFSHGSEPAWAGLQSGRQGPSVHTVLASGPSNPSRLDFYSVRFLTQPLPRASTACGIRQGLMTVSAPMISTFELTEAAFAKRLSSLVRQRFPGRKSGQTLADIWPAVTLMCRVLARAPHQKIALAGRVALLLCRAVRCSTEGYLLASLGDDG